MKEKSFSFSRFIPIIVLLVALGLFFYFHLYEYLSFDLLREKRGVLLQWTSSHYVLAVLLYIIVYTIAVAVSIPGATILTLIGGFLFGTWLGTIFVVFSATVGATIIFLAAKTAVGEFFANKAGPFVQKMEKGFQENAISYMLVLRLVPLFPFWLVNIVPAILNVRLPVYFFTTLAGIIPGSFVYVLIGNGLGAIFDQGKTPDLGIIFKPEILAPLIGLAILSMIPIIYKRIKARKGAANE